MPYPPISWKAHADHQQSLFPTSVPWLVYQYFSKFRIKCNMEWLNLARWAWRYKSQCHLALLRQNGVYPLCCLSSMHIIDKKSIAWLTKHLWLLPHISMPEDHNFLVAPRVLLELDHDSWIILPLFSFWNSLSFALKDQQGFKARLTIGKCGQLHGTPCLIMAFTCRSSPYWLLSFFCINSSLGVEVFDPY